MKKIFTLMILFCLTFMLNAQNPTLMANGIRVTNLTEKLPNEDYKFAVFDSNNILKYYVDKSNVGGGGEGGVTTHNALTNIQGGATNDYYHLTLEQHTKVLERTYKPYEFTPKPEISYLYGSMGFNTFYFTMYSNDDTITEFTIQNGNELETIDLPDQYTRFSTPDAETMNVNVKVTYVRNGVTSTDTITVPTKLIAIFYNRYGMLDLADITTIAEQNTIPNSWNSTNVTPPLTITSTNDRYFWIRTHKAIKSIKHNGLDLTIGAWDNTSTYFITKQNNGHNLYRARLPINTESQSFTYTVEF